MEFYQTSSHLRCRPTVESITGFISGSIFRTISDSCTISGPMSLKSCTNMVSSLYYSCNHVERPRNEEEFHKLHRSHRHHVLLFHDPIAAKYVQYEEHRLSALPLAAVNIAGSGSNAITTGKFLLSMTKVSKD